MHAAGSKYLSLTPSGAGGIDETSLDAALLSPLGPNGWSKS